jgi:branched-chain amino acid transport system permease protein
MIYFILLGMMKGAVFALAGWGFSIVLGILGIVNFSHGIYFILGGYLTAALVKAGLVPWLAIPASSVVVGGVALALQRLLINRVMARSHMMVLVLTLGTCIVCREIMGLIFGHGERMLLFEGVSNKTFSLFGYVFPALDVIILSLSLVIFGLFYLLFRFTSVGLHLRIIGENTEIARILGLNVNVSYDLAMFLCGFWTALAGGFTVFILPMDLHQDIYWTIMSFVVVILGGTGNLTGTFIASLLVGTIVFLSSIYIVGYSDAVIYLLLLLLLLVKPSGLFPSRMAHQERK